jgi:hypothetical protein
MNIEQWLSIISDSFLGLSAIVVAVVAIIGLYAWRRELKGRVLFDVARNIIRLSIELKDNFEWARFPVGSSDESTNRQKAANESESESQMRDLWHARWNRLKPVVANLQALQEMDWEIQALLGEKSKQISSAIKMYRECYADLNTAISEYFSIQVEAVVNKSPYHRPEYLRELEHIIYGRSNDELSKKVNAAQEQLATSLTPFVK